MGAGCLEAAGIPDEDALRALGAREAFLRVRATVREDACLSMLTAFEAGVRGVPKRMLPTEVKADLADFYRGLDYPESRAPRRCDEHLSSTTVRVPTPEGSS